MNVIGSNMLPRQHGTNISKNRVVLTVDKSFCLVLYNKMGCNIYIYMSKVERLRR
jgi:hypothetical protein